MIIIDIVDLTIKFITSEFILQKIQSYLFCCYFDLFRLFIYAFISQLSGLN